MRSPAASIGRRIGWSVNANQTGLELVYGYGVIYTGSMAIKALSGNVIWTGIPANPQNPWFMIISKEGVAINAVN